MMKVILTLAGLCLIVAVIVAVAVLLWKSDGKGCEDKGGPGCRCCPFPCKYNRTGENKEEK